MINSLIGQLVLSFALHLEEEAWVMITANVSIETYVWAVFT